MRIDSFLIISFVVLLTHWVVIFLLVRKVRRNAILETINPILEKTKYQLQREIVRHEATEELLLETRDYLNCLLNSMPSVIIGVDHQGRVTHWNKSAEVLSGLEQDEVLGEKLDKVLKEPQISLEQVQQTISSGEPFIEESMVQGKGVDARYTDLLIHPLISPESSGAVILIEDVTLRVRIEKSMIQNEKMLSLGEMAAGLAHEINNPLAAILSNIQNIQRRLTMTIKTNLQVADKLEMDFKKVQLYLDHRNIPEMIEGIKEAGDRAAKIVKTMLKFSHAHSSEFVLQDLPDLIDQSLDLATNTLDIKSSDGASMPFVIRDISPGLPRIECSPSEIQQVLLNILLNAAQAIHSAKSENPTINIRLHKIKESVRLEIQDNGPGIEKHVQKHIFEPFFTTKEVGSGTGLGLSVSYFIINEHHQGDIELESEPGKGTKFIITLPIKQAKFADYAKTKNSALKKSRVKKPKNES